MKKLASFILLLGCIHANARQISPSEAMGLAAEFMNSTQLQSASASKTLTPMRAPGVSTDAVTSPYYVFNRGEADGFVIISGDDRAPKILGYSDKGSFDSDNLPPQLKAMMEHFEDKLQKLPKNAQEHPSWKSRSSATEIVRLNTALWNQNEPYNLRAPQFDGVRAPIGCVATALAIIMKYHNYPSKAVKKVEHRWYCGENCYSYDFGQMNIDYSLLRDEYMPEDHLTADEEHTISELLYAAAAALNMQFGPSASSATEQDKPRVYREILGFDEDCQYINRECFEEGEWNSIIKEQLNNDMPVFYSGRSLYDGHAFVLDGYDSAGNYHVNWGWGGYENGYYSIDGLLDFEFSHGMTINMRPSQNPEGYLEKYSRQWMGNGTLLNIALVATEGISVNTTEIKSNVPFNARVGTIFSPFDFSGEGRLALLDKEDRIVQLANGSNSTKRFEAYVDEGWQSFGRDWSPYTVLSFDDIYFTCEIEEGFNLAYVTKEDGEDSWKKVLGTLDAPNLLSTTDITPSVTKVNFNVHGDEGKVSYVESEIPLMLGDAHPLDITVKDGIATVFIDGELSNHVTSYHPLKRWIWLEKPDYNVDIYYKSREELIEKSYDVATPGTLPQMISDKDKENIGSIKISGKINTVDLEAAGDLPWLLNIDLEDAEFVGDDSNKDNYIPQSSLYMFNRTFAPPYETIKLPKNLRGFGATALNSYSLEAFDIPASVEYYDSGCLGSSPKGSALSFVNVRNPYPAKMDDGFYKPFETANDLVLFVPQGSKQAYENDELWSKKFKEIIEVSEDSPYIGEYVEDDNARYLILTDFAAIVGFKGKKEVDIIKDFVEYQGKRYPVKYAINNKLNAPQALIAPSSEDFKWNTTITKNVYFTSLRTIGGDQNVSGISMVPGACMSNYGYWSQEMFKYEINRERGLLSISSNIDELVIDGVYINNIKSQPEEDGIYKIESSSIPEVRVEYTLFGEYPVSTIYDIEFNSNLSDSDIELGVESNAWTVGVVDVYNLNGMIFKKDCDRTTLKSLTPGIYIIRKGAKMKKLVIR